MHVKRRPIWWILWGVMVLWVSVAQGEVLVEWDFTRGPEGWSDEAGSAPHTTAAGTLWAGSDQGLSLRSPALTLRSEAFQTVEAVVTSEQGGTAQLLWQGVPYGRAVTSWQGALPLTAPADGQAHEVRLLPLWQNVDTIEGLRLVAPPGLRLRLQRLRIVGSGRAPVSRSQWNLADPQAVGQWLPLAGAATVRPSAEGLQISLQQPLALLISPPLEVPAHPFEWLSVQLTGEGGQRLKAQWACSGWRGLEGLELPLRPGRQTYNFHCGESRSWQGVVRGLALEVVGEPGAELTLHSISLHDRPQGGADLQTLYAGPLPVAPRPNQPLTFVWVVGNQGGQAAREVTFQLVAPEGVGVTPVAAQRVSRLDHGVPEVLHWEVTTAEAVTLQLQAQHETGQWSEQVELTPLPAPAEASAGAIPTAPAVSSGPPWVAAHLYPPPAPQSGPAALDRTLWQRPYLGDYEVGPEIWQWQQQWCQAAGINTWVLDLNDQPDSPERALLDSYLASPASGQMNLLLRWTAPMPLADHGKRLLGQLLPVLARPDYVRLEGRPAVLVANCLTRQAEGYGLVDLHELAETLEVALIACLPASVLSPEVLAQAGYVACADTHAASDLPRAETPALDWSQADARGLPYLPSLQPAWRGELTPARLTTLLRTAWLRVRRSDTTARPLIVVGDYNGPTGLEPRRPHGWQWLQAVAAATETPGPVELLPADVGLGPYDRPSAVAPDRWEFDDKESWDSAMGLSVLRVAAGMLTGQTDSDNPAIFGGHTWLDTRRYQTLVIGLAVSAGTEGRIYWHTNLRKFTRDHSLPLPLIADGAAHEYRLDLAHAPGWEGYLRSLRLDPTNMAGANIALDYVRLLPAD